MSDVLPSIAANRQGSVVWLYSDGCEADVPVLCPRQIIQERSAGPLSAQNLRRGPNVWKERSPFFRRAPTGHAYIAAPGTITGRAGAAGMGLAANFFAQEGRRGDSFS